MVKVADNHFFDFSPTDDPTQWLNTLPVEYAPQHAQQINKALALAARLTTQFPQAEEDFKEGFLIANILVQLHVDAETLCAALIFPFYQSERINLESISHQLNGAIAQLCKGVAGMEAIRALQQQNSEHSSEQ